MMGLGIFIAINLSFFGGGNGGGGFRSNRQLGRRQHGNTPMNNQRQNEQTEAISRRLGLNKDQQRELHDMVTGQGLGFQEILQLAIDLFRVN